MASIRDIPIIDTDTHVVEPPDLFFLRDRGDVSATDAAGLIDEIRKLSATGGPILLLNDISELGSVPAEARKLISQRNVFGQIRALGMFGGTFAQRIIVTLVLTTARLGLRGSRFPPIRYFVTEAEARAWLESTRAPASGLAGA